MKDDFVDLCTCLKDKLHTFSFLDAKDLEDISVFFKCKNISAGNTLWEEGNPCDYAAFIVSGQVQVEKKTELKGNQVVLGIYSQGTFVGELCILDSSPRAVTAVALEDVSKTSIN
jgi:CRP-like cAMP-binding protein